MQIIFSDEFRKDFNKIKDKLTRIKIINHLKKLDQLPKSGKPLQYDLKGHRSIRIPPFRIIYRIESTRISILTIRHGKQLLPTNEIEA